MVPSRPPSQHVYLIGYRGSGKSSVGQSLAERLQVPFVDTDDEIEKAAGRTIRDIFAADGESGFRELESQAIERLSAAEQPSVISLGGGAILREENRRRIRAGRVIWLTADIETLVRRIGGDSQTSQRRPALSSAASLAEEVAAVLAQRQPIYAALADLTIDTTGKTLPEIVDEITVAFT